MFSVTTLEWVFYDNGCMNYGKYITEASANSARNVRKTQEVIGETNSGMQGNMFIEVYDSLPEHSFLRRTSQL